MFVKIAMNFGRNVSFRGKQLEEARRGGIPSCALDLVVLGGAQSCLLGGRHRKGGEWYARNNTACVGAVAFVVVVVILVVMRVLMMACGWREVW